MTFSARLAAQFTLDANRDGSPARVELQYKSPSKFLARGGFIDATTGKTYTVELHHSHRGELDSIVWLNGRTLPEKHRGDIRSIAKAAYCEAFGLRQVIVLGVGVRLRRAELVRPDYMADPAWRALATADLAAYRHA